MGLPEASTDHQATATRRVSDLSCTGPGRLSLCGLLMLAMHQALEDQLPRSVLAALPAELADGTLSSCVGAAALCLSSEFRAQMTSAPVGGEELTMSMPA